MRRRADFHGFPFLEIMRQLGRMSFPAKMLCCLICLLGLRLFAGSGMYDSVEWKTAMADDIGIYQVVVAYTRTHFQLKQVLRGKPVEKFSRAGSQRMSEFKEGETDIFFFVSEERFQKIGHPFSESRFAFFHDDDYVWLERPVGEQRGVAIDHEGKILAGSNEVMKGVLMSLELPRAHPEIDWRSYNLLPLPKPDAGVDGKSAKSHGTSAAYPLRKEFNYRLTVFPTSHTQFGKEYWIHSYHDMNLVVPSVLFVDRDASGRELSAQQAEELAQAFLIKHFFGGTHFKLIAKQFYSDTSRVKPKSWNMNFAGDGGTWTGDYDVSVYMDGTVELNYYRDYSVVNLNLDD